MMLVLAFLCGIEWQAIYNPVSDSMTELSIHLKIPAQKLKFVSIDTSVLARYEIQVKIYDPKGHQLTGDFWERVREAETLTVADSVKIIIPNTAAAFNLRVIDLQGQEILNTDEKIQVIRFLANLRYTTVNDTLTFNYRVMNGNGEGEMMNISMGEMKKSRPLTRGIYDDSLQFWVAGLPSGAYEANFEIRTSLKTTETLAMFLEISRPFYLENHAWNKKVNQLEYIGTPSEIAKLKTAQKEERDSLWKDFWKAYDPTPNTPHNEKEGEYFERIEYCEQHFSSGDRGWRSDRAKVYMRYGPPDETQSRPYELSTKPYEVWLYYRLNLQFIFLDRYGFGEYLLINPGGDRI
jgi:GWxTD domain-containing protein